MNILFVTNMYPVADYQYYGIHVKEQIDSLKANSTISADVFFIDGRHAKLNYLKSIVLLREKIRSKRYDLIHIHYGISGLFLLFVRCRIPVVITLHSGELFSKKAFINRILQRGITMRILKHVDKIIILNEETRSVLHKYAHKLTKLPCGVNIQEFCAVDMPEPISNFRKIGFPGSNTRPEKNYALFNSIIASLRDAGHIIEVVEFHNMTRREVVQNLNQLDLLLMTSTVEGSPQIVKEAMACNIPVVSSDVGDVADLLDGVHNCYIADGFRPEGFVNYIDSLLRRNSVSPRSNGRQKLLKMRLTVENVSEDLSAIYQSML